MILTQRRLNRALLARQGLLERRELAIPDALDAMGTLQAQYAPSMYVGLWSRVANLERDALTHALNEHEVVQGTLMRHTIHLVSRADYWPLSHAISAARRAHWLRVSKGHDLTAEAKTLAAALQDGPLKRKEVEQLIGREALRGIHVYLDLLRVPPSGTWERRRADLYGLAERYIDKEPPRPGHIVKRYLQGFPPAAKADIANWAGMNLKELEPELNALELVEHEAEDGTNALRPPGPVTPRRGHARAGALPADLGRDPARPRPSHTTASRGLPRPDLPHQDAAVDRHVPGRRAGRGHVETALASSPTSPDVDKSPVEQEAARLAEFIA